MRAAHEQQGMGQDEQDTVLKCEGSFCDTLIGCLNMTVLNDKAYCPDCASYLQDLENDPSVYKSWTSRSF